MTYIGDGDRADDFFRFQVPQPECVVSLDAETGFENRERDDIVGSQDDFLIKVDRQAVWVKSVGEDINIRERI